MKTGRIIKRSLFYYFRKNLTVALGIAIGTAVIAGALIVGESIQYSLHHTVELRLGKVTHSLTASDRFFTAELSDPFSGSSDIISSPAMILEGMAVARGGESSAARVKIIGLTPSADVVFGTDQIFGQLQAGEVILSSNLAEILDVSSGESLLFRIRKASLIPLNAPFVSDEGNSVPLRVTVRAVIEDDQMGRFDLNQSQSAPLNAFFRLDDLNRSMELDNRANILLIQAPSEVTIEDLQHLLKSSWTPSDLSLTLRSLTDSSHWEISSSRVFMETQVSQLFEEGQWNAEPILTYFVNGIVHGSDETPYSFVSTRMDSTLDDSGIIVNSWLANDLGLQVGDSVTLRYFIVGPLRELEEVSSSFCVKRIVPLSGSFADPSLVPKLPGLSDVGNCSDWETGIPIDLDKIRDKDEDYWDQYRGTAKAFISYDQAAELWKNRFGQTTAIRLEGQKDEINGFLKDHLDPSDFGFELKPVLADGVNAAANGVDFSELFLSLSFFLLLAGVLLIVLLFRLTITSRMEEIGTLSMMGYSRGLIGRILLLEVLWVAVIGSIVGVVLGIGYNQLVFKALNTIWQDVVRTDVLVMHVGPMPLISGFLSGLALAVVTLRISIRKLLKSSGAELQSERLAFKEPRRKKWKKWTAWISGLAPLALIAWQLSAGESRDPSIFFTAGGLLLISFILITDLYLIHSASQIKDHSSQITRYWSLNTLRAKNVARQRGRSLSIIAMLAIGTFIVIATGANRKSFDSEVHNPHGGSGGTLFFAETSVPILKDLNLHEVRGEYALSPDYPVIQMMKKNGEDASCLNLNRVSRPQLLGVESASLQGRFRFVAGVKSMKKEDPWSILTQENGGEVVYGVADQTVIQWGLGMKIGDTLHYTDEWGKDLQVVLAGGLAASVFQGNILISSKEMIRHYPSISGNTVFLLGNSDRSEDKKLIPEEWRLTFRDYGLQITPSAERLALFHSVENTYLSIFMVMGAFGLLLGTIGLAILVVRTLQERKQEIKLLRALGFSRGTLWTMIVGEFESLLVVGILIGFISAMVAVLPSLIRPDSKSSPWFLVILVVVLLVNGTIWIIALSAGQLRNEKGR